MSKLAREVEKGETVIVARAGIPIMEWKAIAHRPSVSEGDRVRWAELGGCLHRETEAEILAMFDEV